MTEIRVHTKGNHPHASIYGVDVVHYGGNTHHTVTVKNEDYERITSGKVDMKIFVKESFEFLLKHEPAEAIMQHFDLLDIKRHFPDFERIMTSQYARK